MSSRSFVDGVRIITQRTTCDGCSWHVAHEWEDDLVRFAGMCLVSAAGDGGLCSELAGQIFPWPTRARETDDPAFVFEMGTGRGQSRNKPNIIPCIIDFYLRGRLRLKLFRHRYFRAPVVLISSREAYEFLEAANVGLRLRHFPLSISDRYRISPATCFDKKYDLVLAGRTNPVLNGYLERYVAVHRDFHYVYRVRTEDGWRYRDSGGAEVANGGVVDNREQYIAYLRMARAILYSTPGMDDANDVANGFNQVTPRFLEGIACGCHVLARYPRNADTDYYELPRLTPHIDSYEMFEKLLDRARAEPVDMGRYAAYLEAHYTSVRAKQLKQIIGEVWP